MNYFSTDASGDIMFHTTAQLARARAEAELAYEWDNSDEGWHDGVETICWGRIVQSVVRTKTTRCAPGSQFDELWEFELEDVE